MIANRHRICPWWMACLFDKPLRRVLQSPDRLFGYYLLPGMTAVDIGCDMGFFSIAMAKIGGEQDRSLSRHRNS